MRGGIMLPQFAYRGGFPSATGFRTWCTSGNDLAMVLLDIIGHGCPGALEGKPAGQLLANERVVKRFANRQKLLQELLNGFGPKRLVVATGRLQAQRLLTRQPLGAQNVKARSPNLQSLGGSLPVHVAAVKQ